MSPYPSTEASLSTRGKCAAGPPSIPRHPRFATPHCTRHGLCRCRGGLTAGDEVREGARGPMPNRHLSALPPPHPQSGRWGQPRGAGRHSTKSVRGSAGAGHRHGPNSEKARPSRKGVAVHWTALLLGREQRGEGGGGAPQMKHGAAQRNTRGNGVCRVCHVPLVRGGI